MTVVAAVLSLFIFLNTYNYGYVDWGRYSRIKYEYLNFTVCMCVEDFYNSDNTIFAAWCSDVMLRSVAFIIYFLV